MKKTRRENAIDLEELLKDFMDMETLLNNIFKYFSSSEMEECYKSICNDYDISLEEEEEEEE